MVCPAVTTTVRIRALSSTPSLTPTSYVVLGFLAVAGPSTPYDLKKMHAGSVGNFWSVPHSQLYAEPKRLAAAGLVDERREETGRRRLIYEITTTGRRALEQWLVEPATTLPELRDPALLQVFYGADPRVVAPPRAEAHRRQLANYEELRAAMGDEPTLRGPALTLDLGIAVARQSVAFWERLAGER
jgi:PadR family transcriptional regulator, regulatory protein AphA